MLNNKKAAKKLLKRAKAHPDWKWMNNLTSKEIEGIVEEAIKLDRQHGR